MVVPGTRGVEDTFVDIRSSAFKAGRATSKGQISYMCVCHLPCRECRLEAGVPAQTIHAKPNRDTPFLYVGFHKQLCALYCKDEGKDYSGTQDGKE